MLHRVVRSGHLELPILIRPESPTISLEAPFLGPRLSIGASSRCQWLPDIAKGLPRRAAYPWTPFMIRATGQGSRDRGTPKLL